MNDKKEHILSFALSVIWSCNMCYIVRSAAILAIIEIQPKAHRRELLRKSSSKDSACALSPMWIVQIVLGRSSSWGKTARS